MHCTFANFWASGTRQSPTVYLDNSYTQNDAVLVFPQLQANFTNSIIYGANNIELGINKVDVAGLVFTTNMTNCLIRFNDINNQFAGNTLYTSIFAASNNNLMSTNVTPFDPKFKNAIKNQMSLLTGSSAIGNGKDLIILLPDILNINRTNPTDIGAYKFAP